VKTPGNVVTVASTIEQLEAELAALREEMHRRDPARILRRLLDELERDEAAPSATPGRAPDLEGASAKAAEALRRVRLNRGRRAG